MTAPVGGERHERAGRWTLTICPTTGNPYMCGCGDGNYNTPCAERMVEVVELPNCPLCDSTHHERADEVACPRCDGSGVDRMVPLAEVEDVLVQVRAALHRACLERRSTEGYQADFQAINDLLAERRFGGGER